MHGKKRETTLQIHYVCIQFKPIRQIKHEYPSASDKFSNPKCLGVHCIINATTEANIEEYKATSETDKADAAPVSICDVGANADSCATILVT